MPRSNPIALTRRLLLVGGAAAAGVVATRKVSPKNPVLDGVNLIVPSKAKNTLNDASRLSETPVYKHKIFQDDPSEALISALRNELSEARQGGRAVNIGAARHSMGGQAIPRDGHAITLQNAWVEAGDGIYRVQAGARWRDVIGALDPVGLSPKVMQTNSDFGIGATFSVNAHGWPTAFGPMGSTVRSIKIMLADGSLVSASRTEHPEIFAAAMGGYGLIGLLTELELEAVPAALLEPSFDEMPAENFAENFVNVARNVPMAYGRLNIDRANFFKDALLITYRAVEGELPKASVPGYRSYLTRKIFRSQTGNEWVKRRRWGMETGLGPILAGPVSRSGVMNESVKTLLGESGPDRTDIIHEYFVAPDRFNDFLTVCKDIIPSSYQELLNITMRWVEQDRVSLLSYAPSGPRIASVLSFSQEMSVRAENDMQAMTRDLIDAVHALGGNYYLPYRPHATVAQFSEGYKQAGEFAQFKRQTDPQNIFRNALWDKYLARV